MFMTTVDVIVPCYMYGRFLKECVESVLSQTGPRVRVLIIDDASPDDSASVGRELAESDERVTFIGHQQNKGHIATYNEGIEWVSAKYMLLLSADDYLSPGALGRATELMEAHPDVGFVFGAADALYDDGTAIRAQGIPAIGNGEKWRILSGKEFLEYSGAKNIVPTPTAVVRTELLKRSGGYRPELPHTADMEMWWRFAAQSQVGIVQGCQAIYRRHANNMSLGYFANKWLPDLQQRKATLDMFFRENGTVLEDEMSARSRAYGALAREAVGWASWAFNDGEHELVQELEAVAVEIWPKVKDTWAWRKLQFKQFLGSRAWRCLQVMVTSTKKAPRRRLDGRACARG